MVITSSVVKCILKGERMIRTTILKNISEDFLVSIPTLLGSHGHWDSVALEHGWRPVGQDRGPKTEPQTDTWFMTHETQNNVGKDGLCNERTGQVDIHM